MEDNIIRKYPTIKDEQDRYNKEIMKNGRQE